MGELVVNEIKPLEIIQSGDVSAFIEEMRKKAFEEVHDIGTKKGRDAIKSKAFSIRKTKTAIDNAGKELKSEWKQKCDLIDSDRKKIRDELDVLAEEVRQPLTDYEEAEKKRKDDIVYNLTLLEALENTDGLTTSEIEESLHSVEKWDTSEEQLQEYRETGLALVIKISKLLNADLIISKNKDEEERLEAERAEAERVKAEKEAEKARIKKEKEIAKEAKEKAEAKAKKEKEEAEALHKQTIKDAEIARAKAEEEHKQALKEAEAERVAEVEAAKQREVEAEKQRIADIEAAKEEERAKAEKAEQDRINEENRRAADIEHRRKINNEILNDITSNMNISEDDAKAVIKLLVEGKISNVKVIY